jgi:predicted PurR-regulated permease PerM
MSIPPPPSAWFSPGQRKFIALTLTCMAGTALGGVVFLAVWVLGQFIAAFGHVLWPLAIAAILSMLLRPTVNRIESRLKLSRVRAIVLLYVLVVAICVIFGLVLLPLLVSQLLDLGHTLPDFSKTAFVHLKEKLREYPDIYQSLKSYLDEDSLKKHVADATQRLTTLLLSAPSTIRKIFELAAAVAVIPIYLFFLLESNRDFKRDYREQLSFLTTPVRQDVVFLTNEFGLLNVVPFLGALLGVVVILPMAYFQPDGGFGLVLEAGGILVVVQVLEAYYLTPKIMGQHTGLHPMVIILSLFFWGQALHGFLGILLAVPLTAFLVIFWRLLKAKYLPRHGGVAPEAG